MIVYDITDKESFTGLRDWMDLIQKHAPMNLNKIIVGNKCDCNNQRKVSFEEGEALAKLYNSRFYEASTT